MNKYHRFSINIILFSIILISWFYPYPTSALSAKSASGIEDYERSVYFLDDLVDSLMINESTYFTGVDSVSKKEKAGRINLFEWNYFALGDSIASGHGLMDDNSSCRKSKSAYPYKIRDYLRARFDDRFHFFNYTCSGARITPPYGSGSSFKSFESQVSSVINKLNQEEYKDNMTLVTITIGANDFEWANTDNFIYRFFEMSEDDFRYWVDSVSFNIKVGLTDQINRLLEYDNVLILITSVYNPFNETSILFSEPSPKAGIEKIKEDWGAKIACQVNQCYRKTKTAISVLNLTYAQVYNTELHRPPRLKLVNIDAAFAGHESPKYTCGSSDPGTSQTYIQYGDNPRFNSGDLPLKMKKTGKAYTGDCFHPNYEGSSVIADRILKIFTEVTNIR